MKSKKIFKTEEQGEFLKLTINFQGDLTLGKVFEIVNAGNIEVGRVHTIVVGPEVTSVEDGAFSMFYNDVYIIEQRNKVLDDLNKEAADRLKEDGAESLLDV